VEVTLPNMETKDIIVYEGSTAKALAAKFVKK